MMIVKREGFCATVVLLAVLLHACASTPDKALLKKDLEAVNQITIVRYEFPGYMKDTTGSTVAAVAVAAPFMVFGLVGGAIGGGLAASVKSAMMKSAGKELQGKYTLPDFAELVHKEFSERLPKSLPDWPQAVVETSAVADDYQHPSGGLVTIRTEVRVADGAGLQTHTAAQLVDSAQNVLWRKGAVYKSSDLNRPCKLEELEADNAKLLHEEIAFAVERTVVELIDHLKNGSEKKETEATEQKKDATEQKKAE